MSGAGSSYLEAPPKLVAGSLCLDFVNTVEWRGGGPQRQERLTGYDELLIWSVAAGVLTAQDVERCRIEAGRRPDDAAATVGRAIELREALADLLSGKPGDAPLTRVNAMLNDLPKGARLRSQNGRLSWQFSDADPLTAMLWPVVLDAATLLAGQGAERIGHCANATCGWLFIDHSRNRSRRWCSMESCGNRAKARRHYARQKTGDA